MTDATLIAADAALNSLVLNEPWQAGREAEALPESAKPLDSRIARKLSNQTHHSCTDPDATLAEKKGSPRQLKYKVHQSVDADSRVILDTHVTTGARHDNQPYLAQLQRIEQRCHITILEAIADRGYGSAQIIRTLQEQGKQTFIPLWSGRVGNSKYLRGDLVYQKEQDRFQCAAGKYLTPTPAIIENYKRYVASSADCRACAQSSTCPARTRGSSPQRFVLRSLDQDLFEEVQARMRDPVFRTKRCERMWKMEGLFAEAKQNHGLSRARYRGRSKVQIQAYLSAIVQNLKRLVAALWCWLITRSQRHPKRHHPNHLACQKTDLFNRPQSFSGTRQKRTLLTGGGARGLGCIIAARFVWFPAATRAGGETTGVAARLFRSAQNAASDIPWPMGHEECRMLPRSGELEAADARHFADVQLCLALWTAFLPVAVGR